MNLGGRFATCFSALCSQMKDNTHSLCILIRLDSAVAEPLPNLMWLIRSYLLVLGVSWLPWTQLGALWAACSQLLHMVAVPLCPPLFSGLASLLSHALLEWRIFFSLLLWTPSLGILTSHLCLLPSFWLLAFFFVSQSQLGTGSQKLLAGTVLGRA